MTNSQRYFSYTFIYQGRNLLFFSSLFALAIILIRKIHIQKEFRETIYLLLLYAAVYLVFSSFNFYSDRYMLSEMPIVVLLFSFCINTAFNYKWTTPLVMSVILVLQVRQINIHTSSDHNLGYVDVVKVHQQTIDYCVENYWEEKNIYAYFLMEGNLLNPYCGYVSEEKKFHHVGSNMSDSTDYFIFTNVEDKENYDRIKGSDSVNLLIRFEKAKAWAEIYKRVK